MTFGDRLFFRSIRKSTSHILLLAPVLLICCVTRSVMPPTPFANKGNEKIWDFAHSALHVHERCSYPVIGCAAYASLHMGNASWSTEILLVNRNVLITAIVHNARTSYHITTAPISPSTEHASHNKQQAIRSTIPPAASCAGAPQLLNPGHELVLSRKAALQSGMPGACPATVGIPIPLQKKGRKIPKQSPPPHPPSLGSMQCWGSCLRARATHNFWLGLPRIALPKEQISLECCKNNRWAETDRKPIIGCTVG